MKQKILVKPTITQKLNFHSKINSSLKVLEMSNDELFLYQREFSFLPSHQNLEIDEDAYLAYDHSERSLYDEIMEQVRLSKHSLHTDLCEYLIAQLDGNGYFKMTLNQLCQEASYPKDEIIRHLSILRTFEPHGCFAFSLAECLKIQCVLIKTKPAKDAYKVCDYLEDVAIGNVEEIMEKSSLSEEEVLQAIQLIQSLHPKPASNYAQTATILHPECKVEIKGKELIVSLVNEDMFVLDNENEEFMYSEKFRRNRKKWDVFLSLVEKRNITMLQVMQAIVEVQRDFFLSHQELKRCTLEMIAKKCGLHVSTISRAIANKTCLFEHRYYPLKSFFVSGGSKEHSQHVIKEKIKQYIEMEDKKHPYSDESLRQMLAEEGIVIARRTLAKYRESMFIFSSPKRKQK